MEAKKSSSSHTMWDEVIRFSSEPTGRRFYSRWAPQPTFLLTTMQFFSDLSDSNHPYSFSAFARHCKATY